MARKGMITKGLRSIDDPLPQAIPHAVRIQTLTLIVVPPSSLLDRTLYSPHKTWSVERSGISIHGSRPVIGDADTCLGLERS